MYGEVLNRITLAKILSRTAMLSLIAETPEKRVLRNFDLELAKTGLLRNFGEQTAMI